MESRKTRRRLCSRYHCARLITIETRTKRRNTTATSLWRKLSGHNSNGTRVGITIDHIFLCTSANARETPPMLPCRGIKALSVSSHLHMNRESHAIQKGKKRKKKDARGIECARYCTQSASANQTLGYPRPTRLTIPTPLIKLITPPSEDLG